MGFLLQCDNKGCFKSSEALLDPETMEVFCAECGKEIKNVTHFAKVQMKSMGQTMKNQKSKRAFAVQCDSCKKTDTPKVTKDNKIVCGTCSKPLNNLAAPMAQMIRLNIKPSQ